MTALLRDRDTDQYGTPDIVIPQLLNFPVAAATTIWAGGLVATDSAGNALPAAGANSSAKVWGRCEKQVKNTVAEGYGTAGDRRVEVRQGAFLLANSAAGVDFIAAKDVGKPAYVVDDNVVGLTAGTTVGRPVAGTILGIENGQVVVLIGYGLGLGANSTILQQGTLPAQVGNDFILPAANIIQDAIYPVGVHAAASFVTLPAAAADGTRITFTADGINNGFTTQYRDATGPVLLTTALVASKRHEVICVKKAGLWYANAYSAP